MRIFAGNDVTLQDIGLAADELLEGCLVISGRVIRYSNKSEQRLLHRFRVDRGQVAADCALAFQTLDAGMNGRRGQAQFHANRCMRNSSVILDQR